MTIDYSPILKSRQKSRATEDLLARLVVLGLIVTLFAGFYWSQSARLSKYNDWYMCMYSHWDYSECNSGGN